MTTIRELIDKLNTLDPDLTATLVIDDGESQVVCSGDFSVDTAELANGEVMFVGDAD